MSQFKFRNALLCEHASMSAGNKHTLVNVFSGDIITPAFPATIGLAAYVEIIAGESGELKIKMEYRLDGDLKASLDAQGGEAVKGMLGVMLLPVVPLTIDEAGELRLTAEINGQKPVVVIKKRIMKGLPS